MVSQTTQWVNLGIAGFLLVVASIITGMTVKYSPSISTTTSCDIRPQPGDTSTVDTFIKTNWTGPEITGTTGKCLDIRDYLFPKVVFKPTNDPKCAVHFTVKAGSSPNGMMISSWSIAPDEVQYCDTGTFYLYTSLTSSTAVATLTITQATASTAASTFTIDTSATKRKDINFISRPEMAYTVTLEFTASTNKDTSIGTWTNNGLEQQISTTPSVTAKQCVQYRHNLADGLDAETGVHLAAVPVLHVRGQLHLTRQGGQDGAAAGSGQPQGWHRAVLQEHAPDGQGRRVHRRQDDLCLPCVHHTGAAGRYPGGG